VPECAGSRSLARRTQLQPDVDPAENARKEAEQALAYQAVVRLGMGQAQAAVGMLEKAVAGDPGLIESDEFDLFP